MAIATAADLSKLISQLSDAKLRIIKLEVERVTIAANILGIADALDVGPHDKHSAKSCSDSMRGIANELSTSSKK